MSGLGGERVDDSKGGRREGRKYYSALNVLHQAGYLSRSGADLYQKKRLCPCRVAAAEPHLNQPSRISIQPRCPSGAVITQVHNLRHNSYCHAAADLRVDPEKSCRPKQLTWILGAETETETERFDSLAFLV